MSLLATRTSTVSICATGAGAGLVIRPARKQCGEAAGGDRNPKHHETRSFHTLHFPQDATGRYMAVRGSFITQRSIRG